MNHQHVEYRRCSCGGDLEAVDTHTETSTVQYGDGKGGEEYFVRIEYRTVVFQCKECEKRWAFYPAVRRDPDVFLGPVQHGK